MRLSKIKLMGFKSFVDPTVISFPSNRVGVVGPNGCGKSNVIDAVRWVMGESSAKNLRGGAMTDVIFNGSATRKAAEQASIELVFEEVDLPQFPEHSEFSVRREIGRDAQSLYSLNHVRCRRKDITDLFLGTGLGPRSYAIIEQGTISRLIEAKPEELRVFIEEAAGISKYKERRKETEQRMKQTRDNIARLDEVRNELDRQLQKLQKQAKDAEKYQQLQQSASLLKAQLQALRWYALDTAVQEQQQRIDAQAEILQKDLLALQALEHNHKHQREARATAQNTLETAQTRFYELDSHYQRSEQSMTHVNERQEQLQWDLDQLVETCEEAAQQFEADQQQVATLATELQAAQIALKTAQATEMQTQQALHEAETHWQTWQTTWETFNQQAAEPAQQAQVQRTHLQNLEQRLAQNQQRLHRLEEENRGIDIQALDNTVNALETEMATLKNALEDAEVVLETHQEAVLQLRDSTQQLSARLHEHRTQVTQLNGRLASLETLQEAALGRNNADLSAWLHVQGLRDVPRLAQFLEVASSWERAVEIVLGAALQALCVEDMANLQAALQQPPQGQLVIFEHSTPPLVRGGEGVNSPLVRRETDSASLVETNSSSLPSEGKRGFLLDKVKAPWSISSLLAGVWAADDWQEAYQLRTQLAIHESVITPQGLWLGPNWLHSQQGTDERAGTLVREREIHRVAAQLHNLDDTVTTLARELEQQRLALREHETQRDQAQRQVNELRQQFAQLQSQHGGKKARLEHLNAQIQRIAKERAELTAQMAQDDQDSTSTRQRLHAALTSAGQFAEERERLSHQRTVLQETATQSRQIWQAAQSERHQVEVRLESLRTDHARLQQGLSRQQARLQQLHEQRYGLQQDLENQVEPLEELQTELAECQQQRTLAEETLRQAKQTVTHLEKALVNYEEERLKLESRSSELRTSLEQARMECQANQVRRQTLEEQLPQNPNGTQGGFVALLSQLPEDATEASWQAQIEAVERRLQRLGAVNLAALQEFTEQSERKQFFDKQATDLNDALNSLDSAIRTIDREIRVRFKQTLETVNTNLQTMFPRLFGGGQASLELMGEDVLTAGVAIMARPPGKHNSSIHLLSGGEKALTAIALVFSIFEINPAPFCMLDEVDAPLDDTNVGRFCALVKAMSERVQFIFISHNKITMEIADQLIGVTMQEAGVSRPVTVDINTAVEMVTV